MESLNDNIQTDADPLRQLEAENCYLREDNQRLLAENIAGQEKLIQQQIIELRYEESQSRFQAIFNQSKLGKKIIGPDLNITQINPALLVMLGYTQQELVGTRITDYAHADFVHHWHELQESLWTKKIPSFQIETCLIRKDGSVLWCQVTSILFRDEDTTLGYTIVENINKRKKMELALQKVYEDQETIMHMIVHDLKGYLFNLKLLNEVLQENLESMPAPAEEKKNSFSVIQRLSYTYEKALTLVKDILLIGRLGAPGEDGFEETNLNIFISKRFKSLDLAAKRKDIQIRFLYPAEPVYANIIPYKFTHLLENLLTNAIKFTPAGGQITLSLKKIDNQVLLQISDTGIGIPAHLQENIFQKFTKANRVGTEGESTTGLGLYIVKQIVEQHQGEIWVESQEHVGTTFFIQLN